MSSHSELTPSQMARMQAHLREKRAKTRPVVAKKNAVNWDKYYASRKTKNDEDINAILIQKVAHRERVKERSIAQWAECVGERWADAYLDLPQINDRVERFARGSGLHKTSLLLVGDLGVGKTYAQYAYAGELIRQGLLAFDEIFISSEDALAKIATGGYEQAAHLENIIKQKYRLFIFDDVGQTHFNDQNLRQGIWYSIIDHIYSNDLAIVMSTNVSLEIPRNERGQVKRDVHNQPIRQNELNMWLGEAAYNRLVSLLGDDGLVNPGSTSMRRAVAEAREAGYQRTKSNDDQNS